MNHSRTNIPILNSADILQLRPESDRPRAAKEIAESRPLSVFAEIEAALAKDAPHQLLHAQVHTIMLLGRECPFRCLMCDLWKYTHLENTKTGAIYQQVHWALREQLPPISQQESSSRWIKLYNASNFFEDRSVPREDRARLPHLLADYEKVIVENHPKFCAKDDVREFENQLSGTLEVALGLETIHPQVLPRLNKQMTVQDFEIACEHLLDMNATIRAFVLLKPPGLDDSEGLEWALKTVEFALSQGVSHVSIIPTRGGNGAMEMLKEQGHFSPPQAITLESCLEEALRLAKGRAVITADLWDWEKLPGLCSTCSLERRLRLESLNQYQQHTNDYTATAAFMCGCGS